MDCSTAVCYPNCINGECIDPNVCVCDPGWTGLICQIGICEKCKFGVCTSPEACDCFYGYTGHSCDVAVSWPPCHNGNATTVDKCLCEDGWEGRICDLAICEPSCGAQGHCLYPGVCECEIGWYSADVQFPCQKKDPLMSDHNCVEATNDYNDPGGADYCTACDYQFFLDPGTHECGKCNQVYD
jgi:hypothetical protein